MKTSLQQRHFHRVRGPWSWLRKVALVLSAFVALSTLAFVVVSFVFAEEIKAYFGGPTQCVCTAMSADEKEAPKPSPAVDLRM